MKKRFLALTLALAMMSALLAGCGGSSAPAASAGSASGSGSAAPAEPAAELTATQKIIAEAEGMTLEELAKKAIEESNGATFYGVGNSSRGKTALPLFIEYLQSIDPSYNMEYDWQQPKNNKIFDQLTADALKPTGTYAMTLIQDGNQIESKMVQPGVLDTFIPKDWADANGTTADAYTGFLPLQTLNKVLCTTTPAPRPMTTAGTSWPRASTACTWTSTPRSWARTSCTCSRRILTPAG